VKKLAAIMQSIEAERYRRKISMTEGTIKQGVLSQAQVSQSGKSMSCCIDDVWYSCSNFSVADFKGKMLSFETSDSSYNGKLMHWINSFHGVDGGSADGVPVVNEPIRYQHPPSTVGVTGSPVHEPPMAFISNTVAHAIAAGLIKTPHDVETWSIACTDAIVLCKQTDPSSKDFPQPKQSHAIQESDTVGGDQVNDFDDDIPF
jgi:hypothetical protein